MEFKIGDIVWAKIKGYPDWPGVVMIKYFQILVV